MSDFTDRLRDGAHAIADKASDLAERIRERAHAIWEREGHPHGKDQEHFYRAQQELAAEDAAAAAAKPRGEGAGQAAGDEAEGDGRREGCRRHGGDEACRRRETAGQGSRQGR